VANVQPVVVEQATGKWEQMESGVERFAYTSSKLAATVIMYRFDPKQFTFSFESTSGSHGMAEWSDAYPKATLIVNGVYFHDDDLPSGYFVSHGARVGNRSFDLDKSGVIDVSEGLRILDTSVDAPKLDSFQNAAQTYPFFFKGGVPSVKEDTQLLARRTFVGKDKQGNVYIGVVPVSEISLYQTMQLLGETDVEWTHAINLDGGPSTGLFAHTRLRSEELPSLFPVANILVVTKK
jgi:exopolysaccharide biosynthesis protein